MAQLKPPYLLAIDGGTEGIRVGIFDSRGRQVTFAAKAYATDFPHPGWAEQNPRQWWTSLKGAIHEALNTSKIRPDDIAGIAADGTSSTTVCLDKNGNELRPAILWMDCRSAPQAIKIFDSNHEVLERTRSGVSAESMIPKILWIKENQPEIYEKTDFFMEQADWITYKLTGIFTLSINHTSHRWYYDNRNGGWQTSFYDLIGLNGVTEKFAPDVLPMGELVGQLSAEAAREFNLKPGIPVSQGGCDAYMAVLGLNTTKPGRIAVVAGSSHVLLALSDNDNPMPGLFGPNPDAVIPGLYVTEGGQVSSGSIIAWFKNNYAGKDEQEAIERGMDVYDLLNEKASVLPPGSEGLVILDFWQGNRTPYTDYMVRGLIAGLTLKHGSGHLFRAIMEGIAYGTENILQTFANNGYEIDSIHMCGGAVKSPLYVQIHSDVSNVPVYLTEVNEATNLGTAIAASVGAGIYPNLVEASENMVRVSKVIEPNRENHDKYRFYFDKYLRSYEKMKDVLHEITEEVASG